MRKETEEVIKRAFIILLSLYDLSQKSPSGSAQPSGNSAPLWHMTDQKIEQLLEKYFNGTITVEEEQLIDASYESLGCVEVIQLSEAEMRKAKEKIWRAIKARTIDAERRTVIIRRTFLRRRLL